MVSGDHTFTDTGNMRAASLTTVYEWVVKSWNNISIELVQKSLKSVAFLMPWTVLKMIYCSWMMRRKIAMYPLNYR